MRTVIGRIRCGMHSNFKLCCIAFFILVWLPLFRFRTRHPMDQSEICQWYNGLIDRSIEGGADFQYIPCPICLLIERPRVVRRCFCGWEQCAKRKGKFRANLLFRERVFQNARQRRAESKKEKMREIAKLLLKMTACWI